MAARDAGAEVRVVVLYRPVPPRATRPRDMPRALRTLTARVLNSPAELGECFAPLLSLRDDADAAVRSVLAGWLPRVVQQHGEALQPALSAAIALLRDASPTVARAALLGAAILFRSALVQASQQEQFPAFTAARVLCASACLLVRSDNDGVRLQALKFIESAVLLLTAALGAHSDESGVAAGVQPLQPHSALSPAELNRDLRTYLGARSVPSSLRPLLTSLADELLACSKRRHAGPFTVVLVATYANLSRLRPPLCSELLPPLLQLASSVVSAPANAQSASVRHALKTSQLQLLRSGLQAEWQERVAASLSALGHEEAAASVLRQLERSLKRGRAQTERVEAEAAAEDVDEDSSLFEEDAKRQRTEQPAQSPDDAPPTDAGLLRQIVAAVASLVAASDWATLQAFVTKLTPGVVADVVLQNLQSLAPLPPPVDAAFPVGFAAGVLELFSAAGPTSEPSESVAQLAPPEADAAAEVDAPKPAPAVAVALSSEQRLAQRREAFRRILRVENRTLVTGAFCRMQPSILFTDPLLQPVALPSSVARSCRACWSRKPTPR
jgi:hypothetical protein